MRTAPLTGNIGNMTGAYGSNALYHQAITPGDWANGVSPQDTLPADWWNWLWCNITLQELNTVQDLNQIYGEIDNVLSAASIEPMAECCDQLLAAIQVLTPPKDHSSQGNEYGGANTLSYGHVKITDDYNDANADSDTAASSIAVRNLYGVVQNIISTGGAPASDEPPVALGPVALAGTCLETSRADHVHPYPSVLDICSGFRNWGYEYAYAECTDPMTNCAVAYPKYKNYGGLIATAAGRSCDMSSDNSRTLCLCNNYIGSIDNAIPYECVICQHFNCSSGSDYFNWTICNPTDKPLFAVWHRCAMGISTCRVNETCYYLLQPGACISKRTPNSGTNSSVVQCIRYSNAPLRLNPTIELYIDRQEMGPDSSSTGTMAVCCMLFGGWAQNDYVLHPQPEPENP